MNSGEICNLLNVYSPVDVRWKHGVNSQADLSDAFDSPSSKQVNFIECDVGITKQGMIHLCHYPNESESDLSLRDMLVRWSSFIKPKGLKIDLKRSDLIQSVIEEILSVPITGYPLWINADVFGSNKKMDLKELEPFLQCPQINGFSLGILGNEFELLTHLESIIDQTDSLFSNFHVTYAINANVGVYLLDQVKKLIAKPNRSITFWTAKNESVSQEMADSLASLGNIFMDVQKFQSPSL